MFNNDDLTEKRICHECVGEPYLSDEIRQSPEAGTCAYCDEVAPSITLDDLADHIETAFKAHYIRTAIPTFEGGRDGYPVVNAIADAAGIEMAAAEDTLLLLQERYPKHYDKDTMDEESEFSSDAYYNEKGPDASEWKAEWWDFENSLKTEARFFSQRSANLLREVFGDVDKLRTRNDRPPVIKAGPGTRLKHLYRARVFQADSALEKALRRPDLELGSPSSKLANAGRMNAAGISVFYGATLESVAIAEVRAPVGSNVAVAKFVVTRALRLLDLTALEDVHIEGSIFDPSWKRELERAAFLRTLGARMARPVMPDDVAVDYLPTQAVADFLATMNEPRLDGIVFPSAQARAGRNVVLFHHAAKVAKAVFPEGTIFEANLGDWTEDGWERDYSVLERVPLEPPATQPPPRPYTLASEFVSAVMSPDWEADFREVALEIDFESVTVHYVDSINVKTTKHPVRRHTIKNRNPKY
jgi:RES domain-containing protein